MNASVGRKTPHIFLLIEKLKAIAIEVSFALKARELGERGTKRRKVYTKLDEKIRNIIEDFKNLGT